MLSANLIALAGAKITCPECHAHIGTLVKPWFQQFNPGMNTIRFEPGMGPKQGHASCRKCGASYAETDTRMTNRGGRTVTKVTMLLHTEHGWLPKPPPDAPPPNRPPIRKAA